MPEQMTPEQQAEKALEGLTVVASSIGRCAMCYSLEGTPQDCTAGTRFVLNFSRAGGVVLCEKALTQLIEAGKESIEEAQS
jgi:hypothetical protein